MLFSERVRLANAADECDRANCSQAAAVLRALADDQPIPHAQRAAALDQLDFLCTRSPLVARAHELNRIAADAAPRDPRDDADTPEPKNPPPSRRAR